MKYLKYLSAVILICLVSACQKEYSIEGGVAQTGHWEFRVLKTTYSGNLDLVTIDGTDMMIMGKTPDKNYLFNMILTSADSVFLPGSTYKASLQKVVMNYTSNSANPIYTGNALNGEFSVSINQITDDFISGTFSGNVKDSTNKTQQVYQGKFNANYTNKNKPNI